MKASTLITTAVTASSFAFSSFASAATAVTSSPSADGVKSMNSGVEKGSFAPKFDGLRFIETLITAHR